MNTQEEQKARYGNRSIPPTRYDIALMNDSTRKLERILKKLGIPRKAFAIHFERIA